VPEHIVLVGMMGAGKSTVGRLLARRLGRPHVDTDRVVEQESGMSIPDLFASRGEGAFRSWESKVLADTLAGPGATVVSVGGGAVLDPDNRARLRRAGTVVWLRARPDTLARRVGRGATRPLLASDDAGAAVEVLRRIDAERRPLYEEVADVTVDVDARTLEAVTDAVARAVPQPPGPAVSSQLGAAAPGDPR